jgi:Bacterial Ig-like domain (group 1)
VASLSTIGSATASAYNGCAGQTTITVSQSTANGGQTVTLTATVKDCNGNPVSGVLVTFSQLSGPCNSTILPPTAITNAQGVATVTVTLPANCPGVFVFGASAQNVTAQATVRELGGFPATSADAASSSPSSLPWLAVGAGVLLIFAGLGVGLYMRRSPAR